MAGSYERVAAQLDALVALGVAELVIDLHPFIDEAYRFGHHVRPLLIERGAVAVEHRNGALVSMSVDIYWRLPSHGDPSTTRNASLVRGDWTPTTEGSVAPGLRHGEADAFSYVDHLADIARAAESAGFVGGLIPSFPMTDDPWSSPRRSPGRRRPSGS